MPARRYAHSRAPLGSLKTLDGPKTRLDSSGTETHPDSRGAINWLCCAVLVGLLCACGGGDGGGAGGGAENDATADIGAPAAVVIDEARGPAVFLPGSSLRVRGKGMGELSAEVVLRIEVQDRSAELQLRARDAAELTFGWTDAAISALGAGEHSATLRVADTERESSPFSYPLSLSLSLPLSLEDVGEDFVHRYEPWFVRGDGLLAPEEGESVVLFEGTFRPTGGALTPVAVELELAPAELFARDRGSCKLTSALGGLTTGRFEGDVSLVTRTLGGVEQRSSPRATSLEILRPELFSTSPTAMRLGQIVQVRGAGFGGEPGSVGYTVLELEGLFSPEDGEPFKVAETLVPTVSSHDTGHFVLSAEVSDGRLVTSLFGAGSGAFDGSLRAVVTEGGNTLESEPSPVTWQVNRRGQVVFLRFLTGFAQSVELFGLGALVPELEAQVAANILEIYADYGLDVRVEPPIDIDANHYSVVEIGGTDPNGIGLFGYDNTPGKDIGNVRLFDAIGGANAETQADDFPGYGGVFVENFLYFSADPPFEGPRPLTAPPPEPAFDLIFDSVRDKPATLGALNGAEGPERQAAVQEALRVLGVLIADTTAHEIGHSLGLAEPFGSPNVYHNAVDKPGCLMDDGSSRPFGERARLEGFPTSTFCYDEPEYLLEVLGPREM
jgi:hypothetical protein